MLTANAHDQISRNGHAGSGHIVETGVGRDTEGTRSCVADREQPALDWLDRQLLDACRREFPICEKPFTEIARRLDSRAGEVLQHFQWLEGCGVVDRVGPVLAPEPVGESTLVAMAVPEARLQSIAETVMGHRGVHHVCERQHEFNLWFALSAPNAGELYDMVAEIRRRTGVEVLDLRLERRYCGDLEFPSLPPWRPDTVRERLRNDGNAAARTVPAARCVRPAAAGGLEGRVVVDRAPLCGGRGPGRNLRSSSHRTAEAPAARRRDRAHGSDRRPSRARTGLKRPGDLRRAAASGGHGRRAARPGRMGQPVLPVHTTCPGLAI